MTPPKLPRDFYLQDTINVARELLGKKLVHTLSGRRLSGIIVETEAYLGADDPACHSFGYRQTPRTQPLYLEGGHSYVYFIYGMYNCFNVVARPSGVPEAVLIRAIEPVEGIEYMFKNRPVDKLEQLGSGPGKLCQAMAIDKSTNAKSLLGDKIFVEDGSPCLPDQQILQGPRVGIGFANDAIHWPLRFAIAGNKHVSKVRTDFL